MVMWVFISHWDDFNVHVLQHQSKNCNNCEVKADPGLWKTGAFAMAKSQVGNKMVP